MESKVAKTMSTGTRRLIFSTLLVLFAFYSVIVATVGTSSDKGTAYLTDNAKKGKLLYQEYNCTACHQLYGLGGYMGPDLTNVISAEGKGAVYARAFIQSGTQRMPNFNLSESQIEQLVAYLIYVDKTGTSPVRDFSINYDGTIHNEALDK